MEIIRERFAETNPERYNIAPTQDVVTIANDGEANVAQLMRWGLVPSWSKDISIGSRMINARAETLAERPEFQVRIQKTQVSRGRGQLLRVEARRTQPNPYADKPGIRGVVRVRRIVGVMEQPRGPQNPVLHDSLH